ncbi:MAG: DUF4238 domain-containing protein [Methylococcales bacterium]|nr:DUF4238 domain-containing protein [Methylococcales bacterium]
MKKRRQHYVWKKYLEPWCVDGKVWCHRNGANPFHTNPINVAVERDFYELTQLTKNDILFIQKVAIDPIKNDTLRELNAGWISTFDNIFRLNHSLRATDWIPEEFIKELDKVMHNLDEDHHNELEHIAEVYLDSLHKGDTSFYRDDEDAVEFIYFLTSQYFRTKNIRDNVYRSFNSIAIKEVSIERAWPIMRNIFSTCVGFTLYAKRNEYNLVILNNESELDFITSDQPVQNVHAAGRVGELIDEVEFYYPISPRRGVIISNDARYIGKTEEAVGPVTVSYFNDVVMKSAYEQIFSRTAACLGPSVFS